MPRYCKLFLSSISRTKLVGYHKTITCIQCESKDTVVAEINAINKDKLKRIWEHSRG